MSDSGSESTASVGVGLGPPAEVAQVELAEADILMGYLRRMVGVLLEDTTGAPASGGGDASGMAALDSCLRDQESLEAIRKFIADTQAPVLLVERIPMARDVELDGEVSATESEADADLASYKISTEVKFISSKTTSVVLIKRGQVIEADKSVSQQVRVISLTEGNPYETLHSYVSTAVSPFFKSYIRESGRGDSYRDGDKLAPSVEKKLAELEVGLMHLQQNIEIPEISLPINNQVQAVIKKAAEEKRSPKVSDFGDKVEDSSFLNQLQNGVNRWIREIQKVTKLDRDPGSGTALQEITFWLNLERALLKLMEKRESPDIALTLDVLKHGKRFHATVSFDTDTGLRQARDMVNDYNVLMKDFPLNELLSATELERIRSALAGIFAHLRKIRNTRYPIQRCLRLVEAISRDLQQQILKVLSTRRLMHIPMAEFDKLMNACFDVFTCWDDEYDKLQGLLRDLVKKKRDEQMKMLWRIAPAHKKLQARLEQMRKKKAKSKGPGKRKGAKRAAPAPKSSTRHPRAAKQKKPAASADIEDISDEEAEEPGPSKEREESPEEEEEDKKGKDSKDSKDTPKKDEEEEAEKKDEESSEKSDDGAQEEGDSDSGKEKLTQRVEPLKRAEEQSEDPAAPPASTDQTPSKAPEAPASKQAPEAPTKAAEDREEQSSSSSSSDDSDSDESEEDAGKTKDAAAPSQTEIQADTPSDSDNVPQDLTAHHRPQEYPLPGTPSPPHLSPVESQKTSTLPPPPLHPAGVPGAAHPGPEISIPSMTGGSGGQTSQVSPGGSGGGESGGMRKVVCSPEDLQIPNRNSQLVTTVGEVTIVENLRANP